MAFPSGWQRKVAITIDQTLCGTANSTDFTALLTRDNLPDEMASPTDANRAQSDGGDVRFSSDSAGATQLALHVENFEHDTTDAAGDADIRLNLKVPTLDTVSDTVIYAWYSTTGTTSQPASTDTYGSKNAYDGDHCHVWTLDESPSATAPEWSDVVGGRHLTETGGTAVQVTGKQGNAVDVNASGFPRGDYSGFLSPDNASASPATNTGICYIPGDDRIAVANFDDDKIVEINKTTGAVITSFAVTQGETDLQGIAYDSVADQFFIQPFSGSIVYVYDRDGTYDRTVTGGGNAVAYDFADDALWVKDAGSGDVEQINKTTGAQITSLTFTGDAAGVAIEGITHNNTDDTLYITTDTGNMVYEVNKSTGATIQSFRGPLDIEHPAYDHTSDALWVNGDAGFHSGGSLGENVIYKLTPGGEPFDWNAPRTDYTVEFWIKPDSTAGTTILFANWSAAKPDAFYQEFQNRSGTIRWYDTDVAFVNGGTLTAGTWKHVVGRYDSSATELKGFVDGVLAATKSSAAGDFGPDGHLGIGGRPNDTLKHNGSFDSARVHRAARSDSWITARYNNSNNPGTFASAGTPEEGDPITANGGMYLHLQRIGVYA